MLQLLQQHKRRLIIVGIAILTVVIVVRIFSQFAVVNITIDAPEAISKTRVSLYASTDTKTTLIGGPGLRIINSGEIKSIIASAGNDVKTQATLSVPWYRYVNKKITLGYDKNATKIAYHNTNTRPCSTYSERLDSLLSYNCQNPLALTNKKVQDEESVLTDFRFVNRTATPYLGGIAGFVLATAENANGAVLVVGDDGKKSSYPTPVEIDRNTLESAKLFSNISDTNDERFVIVDNKGSIYLGSPGSDNKVSYTHFAPPTDYIAKQQRTICRFVSTTVYCYRGLYAVGDAPVDKKKIRETVTTLSFDNTDAVVTETDSDTGSMLDDFYVTSGGDIYGLFYKKLIRFTKQNDRMQKTEIAQNVDAGGAGEKMYYIQQGAVYAVVDKLYDAQQIFYSGNIQVKHVYAVNDKVFILGSVVNAGTTVYAYQLNDEDNLTPGTRPIDLLPLSFSQLPDVSQQDFYDNNLKLTLKIPINKQAKSNAQAIDQKQFDLVKERVTETLISRGININDLNVTFNY